jgi:hypothetical protein
MTTDIHEPGNKTPATHTCTVEELVARAVQLAMSRDWTADAAAGALLDAADARPDVLGRARVHVLKTNNPHSQVGRRALLALAYAGAAANEHQTHREGTAPFGEES